MIPQGPTAGEHPIWVCQTFPRPLGMGVGAGKVRKKVKVKSLSHVRLFAIPWSVVYQASLSMGFSRQEYWSGLPFPSLGNLPDPGIEPVSPALAGRFFTTKPLGKPAKFLVVFF